MEHFADTEMSGSRSPIDCWEYGLPQDFTDHHFPSDYPRCWFLLPSLQLAVTQPQVLKHRPQSLCGRARANLFSWGTTLLTHPCMCWCNVAVLARPLCSIHSCGAQRPLAGFRARPGVSILLKSGSLHQMCELLCPGRCSCIQLGPVRSCHHQGVV